MDTTIDTLFDAPAEPPADAHAQPAETRLAEQGPAEPVVEVRRSRRRTRTVSAYRDHATNAIIVLVPARLTRTQQDQWVRTMVDRVLTSERRRRPSDEQLLARANRLSARYLDGKAVPASVNWVDNQRSRWGSCTMADRTIRVSKRVRGLPGYVLDYVLLHELAHLIVPAHDAAFWRLLEAYPHTDRARGFLEGVVAGGAQPPGGEPAPASTDGDSSLADACD